jgi:hypothetical protein
MLSRQPRSPASSVSAPLASIFSTFDVRVLDAEGAAEAAADLGFLHLGQGQAGDLGQQRARLRLDAQLPETGTGIVVGRAALETGPDGPDAPYVHQEGDQLVGPAGQVGGGRAPRRIVLEQGRIVLLDHRGAGARRRDDMVVAGEGVDHPSRNRLGVGPVTRIVGRLPAAGLQGRDFDRAAGLLEQLDGREAHAGAEEIDQAGHEEPHPGLGVWHEALVSGSLRIGSPPE